MRIFTRSAPIALLAAVGACSYGGSGVDPATIPTNKTPLEHIAIRGEVTAPTQVRFLQLTYRSDVEGIPCIGWDLPDRGPFPLSTKILVPTVAAAGNVSARIAFDHFAKERCGWQLVAIDAIVTRNGETAKATIATNYGWLKRHGLAETDVTANHRAPVIYCGKLHGTFSCNDNPVGDPSYLPADVTQHTATLTFEIHNSK